jgi:uncharacterized protein YecE (DUF72 family)
MFLELKQLSAICSPENSNLAYYNASTARYKKHDGSKKATTTPEKCYWRLHDRTGYHYKYEEDELAELAEMLPKTRTAYVFFNNRYMLEDAIVFEKVVSQKSGFKAES